MKKSKVTKLILFCTLIVLFLNSSSAEAQMNCDGAYTIENATSYSLEVHWEVVDASCNIICWSGGGGVVIGDGQSLIIPCCDLDIFVVATKYWDPINLMWTNLYLPHSNSVNGTTLTTCSTVANMYLSGLIEPTVPYSSTWTSTKTTIQ